MLLVLALKIVLRTVSRLLVVLRSSRYQARSRWNRGAGSGTLQFLRCLHPVVCHSEHHGPVLLALCALCPTRALRGKSTIFPGRTKCRTHDSYSYPIALSKQRVWTADSAPAASNA